MRAQMTQQLRRDEGVEKKAYQDSRGFWTIGVGRLIDARRKGGLRDSEIDLLLANDIDETQQALSARLSWFHQLDEARQAVLINMAFNLGVDGLLNFKKTLGLVASGDYAGAAKEMLASAWAIQVGDRAKRLSKQMQTGVWQ